MFVKWVQLCLLGEAVVFDGGSWCLSVGGPAKAQQWREVEATGLVVRTCTAYPAVSGDRSKEERERDVRLEQPITVMMRQRVLHVSLHSVAPLRKKAI